MEERVVPHNLDAERAVLGASMIDPDAWPVVASLVTEEDFFRSGHRAVFRAMATLTSRAVPLELLLVSEELMRMGRMEDAGGVAYVAALLDGVPKATNVEYYAKIVKEKARLRSLVTLGTRLADEAYEGVDTAAEVAERAVSRLHGAIQMAGGSLLTGREAMGAYMGSIDPVSGQSAVPTGYVDLDALIKGIKPGELAIVAARPSIGKTALAVGIARNVAASVGPVGFFSIEMSNAGIGGRLLAYQSGVSTQRLERGEAVDEEWGRVSAALEADGLPLYVEDSARTLTEIDAWLERIARLAGKVRLGVVDYIQMMAGSDEAEVAAVSRGLKQLAKDKSMALVALSQLNRAPEGRKDKRPQLADLRGSGALEQDTDLAILIHRDPVPTPENQGVAELIVAKNRNGPTGTVRVQWEPSLSQYRDLAHHVE